MGGKRPSRPPTRWTWTSTGISGIPQVKISTQAGGFAADARQRRAGTPATPRAARVLGPVEVGRVAEPLEDRLDPRRLLLAEAAGADRLLDLVDRRVADLLPGREALAQRGEGAVAVAVVGVLGEDGLDQLGDRVPVRLVDRPARTSRAAGRGSPAPAASCGRFQSTARTLFAPSYARGDGGDRGGGADGRRRQGLLPAGRRGGDADRLLPRQPDPRRGLAAVHGARRARRSRSTCRAGGARTGPTRVASTTRCTGSRPSSSAASSELGVGERKLVVHDWGGLALIGAQRRPELVERLVIDQRRCRCCPATAGTGSPRSGAAARSASSSTRPRPAPAMALGLRQARGDRSAMPPRVRRHDLGATGTRARSRAILALYRARRPGPPRRGRQGPRPARPAPRWSSGAIATPTCRPKFAEAYAARSPTRELETRRGRRPLALDRRPDASSTASLDFLAE